MDIHVLPVGCVGGGSSPKGGICSVKSKFFSLKVDPFFERFYPPKRQTEKSQNLLPCEKGRKINMQLLV